MATTRVRRAGVLMCVGVVAVLAACTPPPDPGPPTEPAQIGTPSIAILSCQGPCPVPQWVVRASWTPPANGGSPITEYVIRLTRSSGTSTVVQDFTITKDEAKAAGYTWTYDITQFLAGLGWSVEIAAVNSVGQGPWSPSSAVVSR